MSLLWLLTPIVLIAGALVLTRIGQQVDRSATELHRRLDGLGHLRAAVVELRVESDRTRARIDRLRRR